MKIFCLFGLFVFLSSYALSEDLPFRWYDKADTANYSFMVNNNYVISIAKGISAKRPKAKKIAIKAAVIEIKKALDVKRLRHKYKIVKVSFNKIIVFKENKKDKKIWQCYVALKY